MLFIAGLKNYANAIVIHQLTSRILFVVIILKTSRLFVVKGRIIMYSSLQMA